MATSFYYFFLFLFLFLDFFFSPHFPFILPFSLHQIPAFSLSFSIFFSPLTLPYKSSRSNPPPPLLFVPPFLVGASLLLLLPCLAPRPFLSLLYICACVPTVGAFFSSIVGNTEGDSPTPEITNLSVKNKQPLTTLLTAEDKNPELQYQ